VDDLEGGADELHAVLFQNAQLRDTDGRVEARLAPRVGRMASGRSFAMILATASGVMGSMYVRSAVSGSS